MFARYAVVSFALSAPLVGGVTQAYATTLKTDRSQCCNYLAEFVRSSNFPFAYVKKEKANLLVDDDNGEMVSVHVVFDTDGSGTIGWVKYDIQSHELLNTSAELEAPQPLTYDRQYAEQYEHCISGADQTLRQPAAHLLSSYEILI